MSKDLVTDLKKLSDRWRRRAEPLYEKEVGKAVVLAECAGDIDGLLRKRSGGRKGDLFNFGPKWEGYEKEKRKREKRF